MYAACRFDTAGGHGTAGVLYGDVYRPCIRIVSPICSDNYVYTLCVCVYIYISVPFPLYLSRYLHYSHASKAPPVLSALRRRAHLGDASEPGLGRMRGGGCGRVEGGP